MEDPLFKTPYTFLKTDETSPAFSLKWDPTSEKFADRLPWETMSRYEGEEGIKRKWKDLYDMGGIDLLDRYGIAGGVSKMATGGLANLTRTVAPDSGPMSQGLRSLYINDKDY